MKKIVILLLLAALAGCSKTPGLADYWLSWSNQKLVEWQVKSSVLSSNAAAYCQGNVGLAELQSEWKNLALHWASLNGFPYLAISDNNLEFDLYFWPDKRNMVDRRLSQRIETDEPLREDSMDSAIAGEKGLTALEWLIFNEEINSEQRCPSLASVAQYYSQQIDSIVQYHEDNPLIQEAWLDGNSNKEGASISLNLSFQQIAQMSNRIRNGFDEQGQPIPLLSEGSRSGLTMEIYLSSYLSIIEQLEIALQRLDITKDSQTLLASQIDQMKGLAEALKSETEILSELILKIQASLVAAEQLIEGPLAQDVGVLIGFNNYDGD